MTPCIIAAALACSTIIGAVRGYREHRYPGDAVFGGIFGLLVGWTATMSTMLVGFIVGVLP